MISRERLRWTAPATPTWRARRCPRIFPPPARSKARPAEAGENREGPRAAVRHYLETGDAVPLQQFAGKSVAGVPYETDAMVLEEMARRHGLDDVVDLHDVTLAMHPLGQHAGHHRRHLDGDLVGLELDEIVAE